MSGREITAWIPHEPGIQWMGGVPPGVSVEVWDGTTPPPVSKDQVEFYVPGFDSDGPMVDVMTELPSLRVVQLLLSGWDHLEGRVPSRVSLCTARGTQSAAVSEWVVTAILASLRQLPYHIRKFITRTPETDWLIGDSLDGKRVLILGYGAVGEAVERRLQGFDVRITRIAGHARENVHGPQALPELAQDADILVILTPLTEQTRNLVDKTILSRLPDGALVVNAARGAVLDEDALARELGGGRLLAALDAVEEEPLPPDHRLRNVSELLYTPHIAAATPATLPSMYGLVGEQLRAYAARAPLANVVVVA